MSPKTRKDDVYTSRAIFVEKKTTGAPAAEDRTYVIEFHPKKLPL
jgi:hypothetical protein